MSSGLFQLGDIGIKGCTRCDYIIPNADLLVLEEISINLNVVLLIYPFGTLFLFYLCSMDCSTFTDDTHVREPVNGSGKPAYKLGKNVCFSFRYVPDYLQGCTRIPHCISYDQTSLRGTLPRIWPPPGGCGHPCSHRQSDGQKLRPFLCS